MRSENVRNVRRRRRPGATVSQGSGFVKFLFGLALLLAVMGGILSFADIGGDMILKFAQRTLRENFGLDLAASGITGNPIRGYTLHDFTISSVPSASSVNGNGGGKILSAKSLSAGLNFAALLRGTVRLSKISVGGVDMDLDQFIEEIQKLNLPKSGDGGSSEIPVDRVSLTGSRFTSKWGTVDVAEIGADIKGPDMAIDLNGSVNGIPVKGSVDMETGGGIIAVNRSSVNFGKGKILATGGIQPVSGTDSTNVLNFQGSVQGLDLKELTALWPSSLREADYDGTANLNLEAGGTGETLKISGTLDYQGTRVAGYPVERAGATVKYADGRVDIGNIQASVFNVPISGEAAFATHPGQVPFVMIKLDGSDAALEGLEKFFPVLKGAGGRVSSFSANVQGPADALSGTVNLAAPRISYQGRAVTNIAAQIKLAKSDTATVNGKLNFEGAQGYVQGTIASILKNPNLNLTAKLVDLDIKRVAGMIPDASQYGLAGRLTASLAIKGSPSEPEVSGTISSPSFSGWGQTLIKPSVTFAFARDTLTLQKSSGTLNGMPINVSGTLGPVSGGTPGANINATITVSPAALKNYVPDIESYALKGNINAGIKIQGRLPAPDINLVASSPNLQALNLLSAKDIEVTTALGGDLAKLDKIKINAGAKSLAVSGVTFSDLSAAVSKDGDRITLSGLKAKSGSGTVTGSGSANVPAKANAADSKLDFSFAFDRLALGPLAAASGLDLKGTLTGALKISGTAAAPAVSFTGSAPSVTAQGFTLSNLTADISGTTKNLKINTFRADVGGAPLNATGSVQLSPELKAAVSIKGSALDLAALTKDYPDLKGQLSGRAALAFDLNASSKGATGKGSVTSSAVRAFGLSLSNVSLPLSYSYSGTENVFASSGGTAKFYNGTLKNTLSFNLASSKFTDQLEAGGVDVNALIQDASGGLDGKITGQGRLSFKLNGSTAKNLTYSGTGTFSMGSGAITGFKWLDVVTRLHGTQGIRYANVSAPIGLQPGKLILKAGSIANAVKNDPLYTYAKIAQDSTVAFNGTLNVQAEGKINYQLVNALTGGGRGSLSGLNSVLQSGGTGLEDGLKKILGSGWKGAQEGGAEADFRVVTLKISGPAASPSVSNLKIGPSTLKAGQNTDTSSASQGTQTKQTSLKEKVVERVVDAVIPSGQNKKQTQTQTQQKKQTQQSSQSSRKSKQEQVKDKVKEELGKGLKKGLEGLFKK